MIPTPILTVLSTFRKNGVQTLLMGGQACVFYGAAQVSKDVDLALLAEPANIERLRLALKELAAERIAVPPFDPVLFDRGHAIHFLDVALQLWPGCGWTLCPNCGCSMILWCSGIGERLLWTTTTMSSIS